MKKDGLENVHTERVMIPRWVRGTESLEITNPPHHVVPMLGLGGSVATPPAGIEAEVMVVVERRRSHQAGGARRRARSCSSTCPTPITARRWQYRSGGASMAARHGAVASLVRAVGPMGLRTPHTGGMNYANDVAKIPDRGDPRGRRAIASSASSIAASRSACA